MLRRRPRKKRINRVRQIGSIAAMGGGVLLAAAIIVLTIIARIRITALSDETVQLTQQLEALQLLERSRMIAYEKAYSLGSIEERAEALGMILPSGLRIEFIDPPEDDLTVVFNGDNDKTLDKPKMIWEYFG
ncbi:MAG: hypothetical protein AB7D36_06730 [Oscillospiraceae bacterium]